MFVWFAFRLELPRRISAQLLNAPAFASFKNAQFIDLEAEVALRPKWRSHLRMTK